MSSISRPPYDAELVKQLYKLPQLPDLTAEAIYSRRRMMEKDLSAERSMTDSDILYKDLTIPSPGGDLTMTILWSKNSAGGLRPAIYSIHGGAMIFGNRFLGIQMLFDIIKQCDAILFTMEYRMAPDSPYPAALEDCYAGLKWVKDHACELGINEDKIMILGSSAGGGLAAGCALLARDRKEDGIKLCAQCLIYPMLDDRGNTVSCQQYFDIPNSFSGKSNKGAWNFHLDGRQGADDVSFYASPARATDLSGLPTAFIDVGSAEPFRDEDVAYATQLWACGVQAELHVWPGAYHAFDTFDPQATISGLSRSTRLKWVKRILSDIVVDEVAAKL